MSCSRPKFPNSLCPVFVCSSLGYTSTMPFLINIANCQILGFAVATIGWILGTTAMGFVEWRVWYLDNTSQFSGVACMGMWRVCVFRHTNITTATSCHSYSYHDTYLPLDIRVSQNLLLMTSILGLLGKASVTFALKNVSMGILEKNTTYKAFVISGILNIAAGICISVALIWNYHSVMTEEGIVFPPSFNLPFKPHAQQIGNTVIVACLAAFVLFLSGSFFLSYRSPLDSQVHPEISGM